MNNAQTRAPFLVFLGVLLVGGALLISSVLRSGRQSRGQSDGGEPSDVSLVVDLSALEAAERRINETVWAKEILAEKCGEVFETLWNNINQASNKWDVLASFSFEELVPTHPGLAELPGHGIELRSPMPADDRWNHDAWIQFLDQCHAKGWKLQQAEIRHNRFETDSAGDPRRSIFYVSAHLTNSIDTIRAEIVGDLIVDWAGGGGEQTGATDSGSRAAFPGGLSVAGEGLSNWFEAPQSIMPGAQGSDALRPFARVKLIDARALVVKTMKGPPGFQKVFDRQITPPDKSYFIDPLIVYDLDGDGMSEIILAAKNLVFRRQVDGSYPPEPLCREAPGLIFTGIIADFDRDGEADFLCAKFDGLHLFKGSANGTFDGPSRLVWRAYERLKYVQALTCGDIDRDGDLDLWLGQYKVPYDRGQMPAPFFDANDGHPSYLFINDGAGTFSDATESSNLDEWRFRRCYAASFADLDEDGDLDLAVVSDFAGVDFYRNDGDGRFERVTHDWVSDNRGFGMAHTVCDFDGDGRSDFLMIGMNSPTADRLNGMGLDREGQNGGLRNRRGVAFGNRLYLRRDGVKPYEQTSFGDSIQRSGWSWGCSAFDWDNDGFPDLYIANGHETKANVRDYESEFWLHDIFVGNSTNNSIAAVYFGSKFARTRGKGDSYGGYEKNRLYWNRRGKEFVEVGHLAAVALEQDSRNVVGNDLDGDGRVDLLVTTFEAWPEIKQTLKIFRNTLESDGNWIGFRLREQGGGVSPVGAKITLRDSGGIRTKQIITGDSFRSQHANTVHFGLGKIKKVEGVEVRWMNGETVSLAGPEVNQYHSVTLQRRENQETNK